LSTSTYPIVEGQYLRDIFDQPRALTAALAQLEVPKELTILAGSLRDNEVRHLVLTGMGASFHALYLLFLWLKACRYTAPLLERP